jgi:murein L,D-transpeptidase YcbB/YkuD
MRAMNFRIALASSAAALAVASVSPFALAQQPGSERTPQGATERAPQAATPQGATESAPQGATERAPQGAAERAPNGATARPANGGQDPANEQFDKLLEAQKRYSDIAANGGWPALPDGDPMKPGERHDCARLDALRNRLEVEGYRAGAPSSTARPAAGSVDATPPARAEAVPASDSSARAGGANPAKDSAAAAPGCEYGPELAQAVKDFQHDRYLTVDGIVGGQTQRQLAKPVDDVLKKIDYALKRWRANSGTLTGTYIVVNIPAFDLAVFEGRSEVLRMPVIVGLPDWQTPEMIDKIDSIVINPSWNIPKSIAQAEVIPKSRKDSGYFAREGIVSDGDGTLSQKPGPRNPLGRLKFMMPNREDVYLHDTPHKQKFAAPARAFSHGCVRVEKPVELAALVLKNDPEWSQEKIQSAIDAKATKTVKVANPMPVHLLYIPAVAGGDGRLRVAPDIYDEVGNASDEKAMEPAPTEEEEFLSAWP